MADLVGAVTSATDCAALLLFFSYRETPSILVVSFISHYSYSAVRYFGKYGSYTYMLNIYVFFFFLADEVCWPFGLTVESVGMIYRVPGVKVYTYILLGEEKKETAANTDAWSPC